MRNSNVSRIIIPSIHFSKQKNVVSKSFSIKYYFWFYKLLNICFLKGIPAKRRNLGCLKAFKLTPLIGVFDKFTFNK